MDELIYFNVKSPLAQAAFEKFLTDNFDCKSFYWVTDFYQYCIENEIDREKTYISLVILNDGIGFKYHYSVRGNNFQQSLRQRIELLKPLAKQEQVEILSTDDEIDPFSMVLIEPNGQTSTVHFKTVEDFIIEDFYNFPFGDFRTAQPITNGEKDILINIIKPVYPDISIWHGTDGPVINGDFNKVKANFKKLKGFDQHYEIRPNGKNEWLHKTEKSNLFIALMKDFQRQLQKDLCIFPPNYSVVQNIEGGSDSEEHCILLSDTGEEKIVYKQRRKSWR